MTSCVVYGVFISDKPSPSSASLQRSDVRPLKTSTSFGLSVRLFQRHLAPKRPPAAEFVPDEQQKYQIWARGQRDTVSSLRRTLIMCL